MMRQYIREPSGQIVACDDVLKVAKWFEDEDNRRIALSAVPYGEDSKEGILISTVFLCIDHNLTGEGEPILFETLASFPDDFEIMRRYTTEAEALKGHDEVVAEVQERLEDQEVMKTLLEIDKS